MVWKRAVTDGVFPSIWFPWYGNTADRPRFSYYGFHGIKIPLASFLVDEKFISRVLFYRNTQLVKVCKIIFAFSIYSAWWRLQGFSFFYFLLLSSLLIKGKLTMSFVRSLSFFRSYIKTEMFFASEVNLKLVWYLDRWQYHRFHLSVDTWRKNVF